MHTADTVVNLRRCQAIIILSTPVSLPLSFNPETRIRTAETPPQASEIISFFLGCTLGLPTPKRTPHDQAQAKSRLRQAHTCRCSVATVQLGSARLGFYRLT